MLDRLYPVELGEPGLGDILQRLAGGIREEMEMEPDHDPWGLWKNMGTELAELSPRYQASDSSPGRGFGSSAFPQPIPNIPSLWITGADHATLAVARSLQSQAVGKFA
jgi:hypothetical protein